MRNRTLGAMLALLPCLAAGADTYKLDPMHSMPTFSFAHLKLSAFRGRFDKVSGSITLDLARHSGSADIIIDINSVSTGVPALDGFLRGARFFDSAHFPEARFQSERFTFSGDTLVAVAGVLTLHGVSKPVQLDIGYFACLAHPLLKVPACGADASVTIKRSDFGLDIFSANDGDLVRLDLPVEALKVDAAPVQAQ
ncbi:MAG: YceI family protein [Pseudomonadota bacterium]